MKINKHYKILAILIVLCIAIIYILVFIEKNEKTLNVENINWNYSDSNAYTIIVKNNGQFVDEAGKVVDEFYFENTIFTDNIYKNYDSDKIWFRGKNHDKNSLKYDIYGYYDMSNNDIEYHEYYYDDDKDDSLNIESVLPLESNVEGRYKLFSLEDGFYLYDQKLNKGVNLFYDTFLQANFIQLNETSGFFNDSSINAFCFVDFEKGEVKYQPDTNIQFSGIYGIYENQLVASELNGEFILIDKDFNITKLCNNVNEKFNWVANMTFIDENRVIVTQEGSRGFTTIGDKNVVHVVLSYIDLENKTMTKLDEIENNGNGHFRFLYMDDEYLYIYSYAEENEYKIIFLNKDNLSYEKELLCSSQAKWYH